MLNLPWEDYFQQPNCRHSRKHQNPSGEIHCRREGPQRGPAGQQQQARTQPPGKEEEGTRVNSGAERNQFQLTQSLAQHSTWSRVFHWASITRQCVCVLTSPFESLFWRAGLIEIWNFLDEKSAGLIWGQGLFNGYLMPWKWFALTLNQIHLLWSNKPHS